VSSEIRCANKKRRKKRIRGKTETDEAASLYDHVISNILDNILSTRLIVSRPRPSHPWFDADCPAAKRLTCRLERAFLAASRRAATAYGSPAQLPRRLPLAIRLESHGTTRDVVTANFATSSVSLFWSDKLTSAKSPCDMWSTVDRLLGRGRRVCDAVSADDLSSFFVEKVERIRSTTSDSSLRRSVVHRLPLRLPSSRHCHLTTLLLPLLDCPTSRPPRIHFRFQCSGTSQIYLRHS